MTTSQIDGLRECVSITNHPLLQGQKLAMDHCKYVNKGSMCPFYVIEEARSPNGVVGGPMENGWVSGGLAEFLGREGGLEGGLKKNGASSLLAPPR